MLALRNRLVYITLDSTKDSSGMLGMRRELPAALGRCHIACTVRGSPCMYKVRLGFGYSSTKDVVWSGRTRMFPGGRDIMDDGC